MGDDIKLTTLDSAGAAFATVNKHLEPLDFILAL